MIHIGPGGVFPDALNPPASRRTTLGTLPVMTPGIAPQANTGQEVSPETSSFPSGLGLSPPSPPASSAQGQSRSEPALRPSANPSANPSQQPRAAAFAQQPGTPQVFGGGGIAGVASQSTAASIKVWNERSQYNEWEFIYDYRADPLGIAAVARVSGPPAQIPAQPAPPGQQPLPQEQQPAPGAASPTQQFSPPPQWLGPGPPGVRPNPQFPPSPIPRVSPAPQPR